MKTYRLSLRFSLLALFGLASLAVAASPVRVEVKVTDSAKEVVYQGKTDAGGTFATRKLAPGEYVVQFNAEQPLKGGPFALAVSAGKESTEADSLPARKFSKGGVAMLITVKEPSNLTGKIGAAGSLVKKPAATQAKGGLKTKVENGRKLVWIAPEQGGWLPGKWVTADSVEGRNALAEQAAKGGRSGH